MKIFKVLTLAAALAFAGCENKSPVETNYGAVCQPENNGKYVSVSGYLNVGELTVCRDRKSDGKTACLMELRETPNAQKGFGVSILQGGGENQMNEIPPEFKPEDIKIRAADNSPVSFADRVKITGKAEIIPLKSQPGVNACTIAADKIEKQ